MELVNFFTFFLYLLSLIAIVRWWITSRIWREIYWTTIIDNNRWILINSSLLRLLYSFIFFIIDDWWGWYMIVLRRQRWRIIIILSRQLPSNWSLRLSYKILFVERAALLWDNFLLIRRWLCCSVHIISLR